MQHGKKIQEKVLLQKARYGDTDAYAEIYNTFVDRIYRFVFFKVSSRQEAEDITSEIFLKSWKYITEGQKEVENLNAFLYQIARNKVIDFYRKKSRDDILVEEDVFERIPDVRQQNLLVEVEITSDMEQVQKVLQTLKDEYKDVILLRYIEELSIAEIAQALDKTNGSVRVLLHRAIKILREKLKD